MQKTFAIIGYGNQARAWAHNLKDSGYEISIFLRPNSSSIEKAQKEGFKVFPLISEYLSQHLYFAVLTPDHTHLEIVDELKTNSSKIFKLIYAHGFSMSWGNIPKSHPEYSHLLLAPKAIATELRHNYLNKKGLGGFYSVEYGNNKLEESIYLKQLGHDLGFTVGPIEVSAIDETNADLWSEQSLLCGTLPYLAQKSYQKARDKGIPAELAYFECWYEVKLIADAMISMGPLAFFDLISPNALMGSEWAKNKLFTPEFDKNFDQLWDDLENGSFKKYLSETNTEKMKEQIRNFWRNQELESVHKKLSPNLFGSKT